MGVENRFCALCQFCDSFYRSILIRCFLIAPGQIVSQVYKDLGPLEDSISVMQPPIWLGR